MSAVESAGATTDPAENTSHLRRLEDLLDELILLSTDDAASGLVALSAGAVWAVAPDFSVVRIDSASSRITATTRGVAAAAVATGVAGVWVLSVDGSVARRA